MFSDIPDFIKLNPLLAPLALIGGIVAVQEIWKKLKCSVNNIRKCSLEELKNKYKADWAFIADVSKPMGAYQAEILSKHGYNICTLNNQENKIGETIRKNGKSFESIEVSPYCAPYDENDSHQISQFLQGKSIGIVIMNLFYEFPCNFENESPMALTANINACVIKTADYLNIFIRHLLKQENKSAIITIGSILSENKWPGFQVSAGCAKFIEKYTESIKNELNSTEKIDVLHLKKGYVPKMLKNSFYNVDEKIEAENCLKKIGVSQYAMTHYKVTIQNWIHNCCKFGKLNRLAYSKVGVESHYQA